jgi:DNA repair protein RecO (recombination protein O)
MSVINKTEALALRIVPYSRTSQVVTWLTPGYGKLTTMVKGACRPKSLFLGQYDLFYTCELVFYRRDHSALSILKECTPLNSRDSFRQNWKAMICASYVCDVVARASQENHRQPDLYNFTTSLLDSLCNGGIKPHFLPWFELRLTKLLGISPQLSTCVKCKTDMEAFSSPVSFSYARGGILCPACEGDNGGLKVIITPDIPAILRRWQTSDSPAVADNTRISPKQLIALGKILGTFIGYHLDIAPVSRSIALDTIQETAPRPANRTPGMTKK